MQTKLGLVLALVVMFVGCNNGDGAKADGAGDGTKIADSAAIQGKWNFVEVHEDGKAKRKEKFEGLKLEIAGDKITISPPGNEKPEVITIKLDEAKKHIDMTMEKTKKIHLGLYELKGDDLRIVFSENNDSPDRANKFETEPKGPNGVMFVLRRAK
jgi:uncharacterized protein (TIGR03067 family)